ncbi:MAG: hypothetical protein K9M10_03545 [Candidatus Pacebacteria bacterium]|nr:hypothetical protein [Candidatus Paceibacterota bacterium]MCF7857525.1 hypothetical protein [Candidatus Paceibacterota bacterium]
MINQKDIFIELNAAIVEHNPTTISSSWISATTPRVYRYVYKHYRSDTGGIDWDYVTSKIDRSYQSRWRRYRYVSATPYEDKAEVDKVLVKYKDKLYTLITTHEDSDREYQDKIIIALVRLSQKGNVLARKQLTELLVFVVNDWIDRYYYLQKWKGYSDDIEDKIARCIRCYRYTESFLGYLYKTLEYSGRGIVPIQKFSLDDKVLDGAKTKLDYIAAERVDMCTPII